MILRNSVKVLRKSGQVGQAQVFSVIEFGNVLKRNPGQLSRDQFGKRVVAWDFIRGAENIEILLKQVVI